MGIIGDITNRVKDDLVWKAGQGASDSVISGASKVFKKDKDSEGNKKCPKCKARLTDSGLKFCPDCGYKLIVSCKKCNLDFPVGKKFCTQCGKKL